MAGIKESRMLRDLPEDYQPEKIEPSKFDQMAISAGKIRAKPSDQRWAQTINDAVEGGLVSRGAIDTFVANNPNWGPLVETAYARYQQKAGQSKMIGQYVNPGAPAKPEVPFNTTEEQEFGLQPLTGNVARLAQEAVPAKRDYAGLADAAFSKGQFDLAKQAREAGGLDKGTKLGELTIPKALGGAHGIKDMTDVAKLAETEGGRKKLKEFVKDYQSYNEVTSYDENGNVVTNYVPKLESRGRSADKTVNKRASDLYTLVDKSRLMAVGPALKVIDSKMSEYEKTGKIEGVGNLKNIRATDWVKTQEGRYMVSVVQLLENEELRQASGLAVTEPEAARKEVANALKAANTADDYARVFKTMIRPRWNNLIQGLKASSGNDAYEVIKRRGIDLDKIAGEEKQAPSKGLTPAQQRLRSLLDGK